MWALLMLTLITAPTAKPISLEEAKAYSNVVVDDFNDVIAVFIDAAVDRTEVITGRQIMTATWDYRPDNWNCLELPRSPLQSVTSVKYFDTAGVEQTLATTEYRVSAPGGATAARGVITLKSGKVWPSLYDEADPITIRFVAGYGNTPASVPATIKLAMLKMVATWWEHRESTVVGTIGQELKGLASASSLLKPYWDKRTPC